MMLLKNPSWVEKFIGVCFFDIAKVVVLFIMSFARIRPAMVTSKAASLILCGMVIVWVLV